MKNKTFLCLSKLHHQLSKRETFLAVNTRNPESHDLMITGISSQVLQHNVKVIIIFNSHIMFVTQRRSINDLIILEHYLVITT